MIRTVYDVQDLENPFIPSRSRLYHLEPIGIGTPLVESLTSYISRLAEAHCVSPKSLVINEILPVLGREYKARSDYQYVNRLWIVIIPISLQYARPIKLQ